MIRLVTTKLRMSTLTCILAQMRALWPQVWNCQPPFSEALNSHYPLTFNNNSTDINVQLFVFLHCQFYHWQKGLPGTFKMAAKKTPSITKTLQFYTICYTLSFEMCYFVSLCCVILWHFYCLRLFLFVWYFLRPVWIFTSVCFELLAHCAVVPMTFQSSVTTLCFVFCLQLFHLPAKKNVDAVLEDYANYKKSRGTSDSK